MLQHRILGIISVLALGSMLSPRAAEALKFENTFAGLVNFIVGYINLAIPIIITLVVVYYMWHTAQGILKMKSGKVDPDWQKTMFWGLIAIALMVSIWGVLQVLAATFQIQVG